MVDVQVLINIVFLIITILLVVVLVQVIFLLKDLKTSLFKVNKILDDSGEMSESIKQPIVGLSKFLVGLKSGASFLSFFKKLKEE
jgi:hypothetical protein